MIISAPRRTPVQTTLLWVVEVEQEARRTDTSGAVSDSRQVLPANVRDGPASPPAVAAGHFPTNRSVAPAPSTLVALQRAAGNAAACTLMRETKTYLGDDPEAEKLLHPNRVKGKRAEKVLHPDTYDKDVTRLEGAFKADVKALATGHLVRNRDKVLAQREHGLGKDAKPTATQNAALEDVKKAAEYAAAAKRTEAALRKVPVGNWNPTPRRPATPSSTRSTRSTSPSFRPSPESSPGTTSIGPTPWSPESRSPSLTITPRCSRRSVTVLRLTPSPRSQVQMHEQRSTKA